MADRIKEYAEALAQAAAIEQMIDPAEILGRSNRAPAALARQCVAYAMRERARLNLADIGRALDGRDHSTIHHGISKVARWLRQGDPDVVRIVGVLKAVPVPHATIISLPVSSTAETDALCEQVIDLARTVETLGLAMVAMAQSLGRQAAETRNVIRRAS